MAEFFFFFSFLVQKQETTLHDSTTSSHNIKPTYQPYRQFKSSSADKAASYNLWGSTSPAQFPVTDNTSPYFQTLPTSTTLFQNKKSVIELDPAK